MVCENEVERTFVALKPDTVERKLVGRVIQRFEDRGFEIVEMRMLTLTGKMAEEYYGEHKGKEFYEILIKFMTSGRIVAMVIKGERAISTVRKMLGNTCPCDAEPGTIRGDFGLYTPANIIHASDSLESAEREIDLFFGI
ncbi:nucleoside-diphosphate kinase [Methanococcus maripaludis]|uniref:Nucleoside diphosphate kinase n=1 Tax=Methanococcus maripaludis TaxID=39152 RepID=A0A2L1CBB8_METMI|nr:nucleoside-diphosphate kinase [Methanococcus maripaludis]AVB76186.1 Nucleoside diphosphate kinase [Methanococcus maripaludis]MBA2864608.1 nucleoside-diphosphate kinase [Methanococcus maripaludis]MBB6497458.1 nucleoside-diphosphate kinase [Methanococcus maripaludis]